MNSTQPEERHEVRSQKRLQAPHTTLTGSGRTLRDPAARDAYLRLALADIPRLLGAIDRNPFRPTYGCFDRQFWHYRTAPFPSEMYQEAVLALAQVYRHPMPGNRWHAQPRLRELAIAALRFAARSSHRDGSCDDYYPFERALGAAVFSLQAAARAYRLLEIDDAELRAWFKLRAQWIAQHGETGRLANHHALAALGLFHAAEICDDPEIRQAAQACVDLVLTWQLDEGWFEEYGGADPGYQTVTIDALAQCRPFVRPELLDEPLRRAVAFARLFLHPDGSYAGEYGSRGTYHFYPHGFELLAGRLADAADLADGFLRALAAGRNAAIDDDRLLVHRTSGLIDAWLDWSPDRPAPAPATAESSSVWLGVARLLVRRSPGSFTCISAARGGVFKHFGTDGQVVTDAGLVVETEDGRRAVSQTHDLTRRVEVQPEAEPAEIRVSGPLHWWRPETVGPIKQILLHGFMLLVGRWCRNLVRWLLQRRLITGRSEAPIRFARAIEFLPSDNAAACPLRVTDQIVLTRPGVRIRRMAFGTDHQAAYVAATGVYQESVLRPWTDLAAWVNTLNDQRSVTIVREIG